MHIFNSTIRVYCGEIQWINWDVYTFIEKYRNRNVWILEGDVKKKKNIGKTNRNCNGNIYR